MSKRLRKAIEREVKKESDPDAYISKYGDIGEDYKTQLFKLQYYPYSEEVYPTKVDQLITRQKEKFYGKGAYRDYLKYVPRVLGAAATAFPSVTSGDSDKIGRALKRGWKKGSRISKIMGMGDYGSTNQIMDVDMPSDPNQAVHHAMVAGDLSGDIVYSNTEFITNVYASAAGAGTSPFELRLFDINPALSETFPFLSQLAQNFELYEFLGLAFHYKPNSGDYGNSNSNSLGKVVLATNYDPEANPYSNSIVMENYDYACSTKPSSSCLHGVECAPQSRSTMQLYTRTGASNKSKIFTDLGKFQLATEGIPFSAAGEALVGELWVTYTVKLSRAKLGEYTGQGIQHALYHIAANSTGTTFIGGSISTDSDNEIDVSPVAAGSNNIELSFPNNSKGKRYLLTFSLNTGAAAALLALNLTNLNGITPVLGDLKSTLSGTSDFTSYATFDVDAALVGTPSMRVGLGSGVPANNSVFSLSICETDPDFTCRLID